MSFVDTKSSNSRMGERRYSSKSQLERTFPASIPIPWIWPMKEALKRICELQPHYLAENSYEMQERGTQLRGLEPIMSVKSGQSKAARLWFALGIMAICRSDVGALSEASSFSEFCVLGVFLGETNGCIKQ